MRGCLAFEFFTEIEQLPNLSGRSRVKPINGIWYGFLHPERRGVGEGSSFLSFASQNENSVSLLRDAITNFDLPLYVELSEELKFRLVSQMTDAQVEVEEKLRRKKEEEEEMWREYAEQRRLQRLKEEEELRKLKVSVSIYFSADCKLPESANEV